MIHVLTQLWADLMTKKTCVWTKMGNTSCLQFSLSLHWQVNWKINIPYKSLMPLDQINMTRRYHSISLSFFIIVSHLSFIILLEVFFLAVLRTKNPKEKDIRGILKRSASSLLQLCISIFKIYCLQSVFSIGILHMWQGEFSEVIL